MCIGMLRRYCVQGRFSLQRPEIWIRPVLLNQGAVLAMTRELAIVHAREAIRLNTVSP
jgi:hypothetical protein